MKCLECTDEGLIIEALCEECHGEGEVSSRQYRQQLADMTADDKNDEQRIRKHEQSLNEKLG